MAYVSNRHTMLASVLTTFVLFKVTNGQSDNTAGTNIDNSITFNVPLTVMWSTKDGRTHELTAFRHRHNDDILEEVKTGNLRRVPKLRWVSYGRPVFVRSTAAQSSDANDTNAIRNYFRFTPSGFYSYIQMLTEEQKALLARQAGRETHLNITTEQILNIPLTKFECSMIFHDEKAKKYLIKGAVGDFKLFPLRMDFEAPGGTIERERLVRSEPEHLVFNCRFSIQAQITRTNKLSITSQQLQDSRIEDKLFGDAEEGRGTNQVYVTRQQMWELASEVYSTLDIMEDSEVPESAFNDAFVDEVVRQLSSHQFSLVPIDTVLSSISKYSFDFTGDITADRITNDLGRVLKIEQVGEKVRIVAATSRENSDETVTGESGRGSLDVHGSGWGISAGFRASTDYARSNERRSSEAIGSLDDQLKELNHLSRNEAEWKIDGDKVVPKSLNVAKLSRTRLGNNITFNRIRRQISDAAFDYPIKLYLYTDELSSAVDLSAASCNFTSNQLLTPTDESHHQVNGCLHTNETYYTVRGCYKDAIPRDLPVTSIFSSHNLTLEVCAKSCRFHGYPYAGVQNGAHCSCGRSYGKYGKSQSCDKPCTGNSDQVCGGLSDNTVLEITRSGQIVDYEVMGCYNDGNPRDLPHSTPWDYKDMTLQKCAESCDSLGHKYAGVQDGYSCWCGDSFGHYNNSDGCNIPCKGCVKEICGGERANTVLLVKQANSESTRVQQHSNETKTSGQDLDDNGNVNSDSCLVNDQQLQLLNEIVQKMNQQQEAINKLNQQQSDNGQHNFGPPGWILVQQHYNGSTYFHRGWNDYKNGFGNTRGDYWLGNDRLNALTSSSGRYKVRFDLQSKLNSQWYWAEYSTFSVGTESTLYKLTVSGYSGNAGDSFGPHSERGFSTLDRNNPHGCATGMYGFSGGFWYYGCGSAAINASPLMYSSNGPCGFYWHSLPVGREGTSDRRLMTSRMWLVPK